MTLRSETTVEYHFNDPYLFFCKHHSTLGISESHGDSVQLEGVDQDNINDFIKTYFEYVLDDAPMLEYFKERLKKVQGVDSITHEEVV
tara:strand:- start:44 stop:307 length:264 start_codon:yes stop_codon:yes gene_type:complete